MAIITQIKEQKKKNRINVYLDNKFGFGIDIDNFVILGLKINQELSEDEIEQIVKKSEFQKTLDKLIRFTMTRPKSEKEVKDYLTRKKIPEVIWKDLFSKLKNYELIDDEKFAKWWVEVRQEFSPKSERILKYELKRKGIKNEIIEKILEDTVIDEKKIAKNLLDKRKNHWQNVDKKKKSQKMLEYLVRKGFDFEIAKKVVNSYNT
jgi:regulatory protein